MATAAVLQQSTNQSKASLEMSSQAAATVMVGKLAEDQIPVKV